MSDSSKKTLAEAAKDYAAGIQDSVCAIEAEQKAWSACPGETAALANALARA